MHGHHDQLRHTITNNDVVYRYAFNVLGLRAVHDGFAWFKQAFAVGVTTGFRHIAYDVLLNFFRHFEAKCRRVAYVQLDDALAFFFHLTGTLQHRATYVVTDIGQLIGFF